MTIPSYRLARMAEEEASWQRLVNVLRRLVGLPVIRTSQEAAQAYFRPIA